ncbi:thioesterase family protein [Spirulina major CS-329]|uniref:acyl-CoA thioesterase n=1 Tax=Spirulina TaxID=1154 RepID=UPI00232C1BAC|nr:MULTISPECIES: thioesterase family protein [Spirulina]MDB9494924.1 thioesterase family protein [Spirulina subsalsa CS-330]MDB9504151.1 thioesterase family protein [Spirulina major CS-329]
MTRLFRYTCTVPLGATDAAGVIYFARLFDLCHAAYEAAFIAAGLSLRQWFESGAIALPIVHCDAQFKQPIRWCDRLQIDLHTDTLSPTAFQLRYTLYTLDPEPVLAAIATTKHVSIDPTRRQRALLPPECTAYLSCGLKFEADSAS